MNFYLVRRVGTGTTEDPHRPDLPDGTSWVGVEHQNVYLVGVEGELPAPGPGSTREGPFPRTHERIKQAVTLRGRTLDELDVWRTLSEEG